MTKVTSDSEISDLEEDNFPSSTQPIDFASEANYEKLKELVEARDTFQWRQISSVPETLGKKTVNERITQAFAPSNTCPKYEGKCFPIQDRFRAGWVKYFGDELADPVNSPFTRNQLEVIAPMAAKQDVSMLCRSDEEAVESDLRALYCLQAMQLATSTRSRILKNSQSKLEKANSSSTFTERDQGFSRPQTLILLPFRNAAFDCIKFMATMWKDRSNAGGAQIENWSRFEQEYGPTAPLDEMDAEAAAEAARRDRRPESFKRLFRGNIDDCFRVGIKFTRKSMKLFADFYSADIILASPLGLRLIVDGADSNMKSGGDWDFLSSVELLVIDQADAMLMQNWDHLERVMEHMNRIPRKPHGCDFSRVRSVYLDGFGRHIRQSLVFSRFVFPELNSLLGRPEFFANCYGTWRCLQKGAQSSALLKQVASTISASPANPSFYLLPMKSERTNPTDVLAAARYNFFCGKIVPALMRLIDANHLSEGICIFVPSYFDFCQLKAHFKKANEDDLLPSFVHLSEYTTNENISRARSRFFNGHSKILLVTERFYYFRRYQIRGIRHLIFYGLPEFPEFFSEWISMVGNMRSLDASGDTAAAGSKKRKLRAVKAGELDIDVPDVPIILAPLDYLKLERIFGRDRARSLLELQ